MHQIGHLRSRESDLFQFLIMAEYRRRRIVKTHLSMVHDNDPIHIPGHILHTVGDQDHCDPPLLLESFDLVQDLIPASGIQTRCRLIQDQHLRFHGKHACDGHTALLSAGQLKRRAFVIFLSHAHHPQSFSGLSLCFLPGASEILRAETHIRKHINLKELMLRVLEDQPHLTPQLLHGEIFPVDISSIKINPPACSPDQAVQMLDQGRFSRAGMSDETDKLTVRDLQVDILQSVNLISGIFCICIIYIFDFN